MNNRQTKQTEPDPWDFIIPGLISGGFVTLLTAGILYSGLVEGRLLIDSLALGAGAGSLMVMMGMLACAADGGLKR